MLSLAFDSTVQTSASWTTSDGALPASTSEMEKVADEIVDTNHSVSVDG